jgi:hypothetical protein
MRRALLSCLVTSSLAGLVASCSSHACGLVGCGASATLRVVRTPAAPPASPLALVVCRNDDCRSASIAAPTAGAGPSSTPLPAADPSVMPSVDALLSARADQSLELDVHWFVPGDVTDGDRYTITVHDAQGHLLVNTSASATYATSTPNGPDCAPVCKSFEPAVDQSS